MNRTIFISLITLLALLGNSVNAQSTYTEIQYEYRVDSSVYYGTATNYAGNPVDLYMDIYKPLGDENRYRPVVVMAFGGAWIGGDKRSYDITTIAPWFAKRGYVVAAIDYRLGFHPSTGVGSNYLTCPAVTQESNCVYPADSNEVIRAIFRGMQDVKGAVRFMKGRNADDSTCVQNVFVAGVSAGGFNALAAAFLDDESEKSSSAFALADAVGPPNTLNYCHDYQNALGATISRARPDLGSIEGDIAMNGYNAEVKGVANFIGGMLRDYFVVENGESPLIYLHHQTSDLIVDCNRSPLLSSLSYTCLDPFGFLGCNHVWNMPRASGSCSIQSWLNSNNYNITHQETISQTGGPNCLQDPPGHSVVNPQLRVEEVANFFSSHVVENQANGCDFVTSSNTILPKTFSLYPNPANDILKIQFYKSANQIQIFDARGKLVLTQEVLGNATTNINLNTLSNGLYFCHAISADKGISVQKFVVQH
jgi:dienelactone hydrolase